MGFTISEFYELTPSQFYNICHGYGNKLKAEGQASLMQTKIICWNIYLTIPSKRKKLSFEEYANKFFGDKESSIPKENIDEATRKKRAFEMFKKIDNKSD